MKTIDNLSHGGQIRRLRELAEAALTHYDLGNARISMLSRRENIMFQVVASPVIRRPLPEFESGDEEYYDESVSEEEEEEQENDAQAQSTVEAALAELSPALETLEPPLRSRYALRLYTEPTTSSAMITSELQWLAALRRDTGLGVPEPVATRNGGFLTKVLVEGMPEEVRCVVFRWVDGRFIDAGLTSVHLERVGVLMARLHHHARTFSPPAGFLRPRWNWLGVFGEESVYQPHFLKRHAFPPLKAHDLEIFRASRKKIEVSMRTLPQDAENYGLIHNDLQQANYLFYKDEARAIDFKQCSFGYYLFDIAHTLAGLMHRPGEQALREAFFRGYTSMRILPPRYEERLEIFMALYLLQKTNQLLSLADVSAEQATLWLDLTLGRLKAFLA